MESSYQHTKSAVPKRKTLHYQDLLSAVRSEESLDFLLDIVPEAGQLQTEVCSRLRSLIAAYSCQLKVSLAGPEGKS